MNLKPVVLTLLFRLHPIRQYDWEHCVDMKVGQTYEIHWPHSTVGACGTPFQYQTPFYDGTLRDT